MTTHSATPEAEQARVDAFADAIELPPHVELAAHPPRELVALHCSRTYKTDAITFDDVTAELHDIDGSLEMLALIRESTCDPQQCHGDHHAALFRVLNRDTQRRVQRLEGV